MEYTAHGSYQIKLEDNILHVEAYGPFNEVFSKQYYQEMKSLMRELADQPWATLVTYHGNGIFTPEAEQELTELTQIRAEHGMVANASVLKNSIHTDMQHMQLARIYDAANIPCHVFSEQNAAQSWLKGYLAKQKSARLKKAQAN